MKKLLPLLLALAACNPADYTQPESPLERQARALLACPAPSPLTWATDLGSIDALGNFTSPGCPNPYRDQTANVTANGCGKTVTLPVAIIDSAVTQVQVVCGVIGTATCCSPPPFTVAPGTHIQMFAQVAFSCSGHVVSDSVPPAMCP